MSRPWRASVTTQARFLTRGKYSTAPHCELVADCIDRAVHQGGVRALISMPPRHSKTFTATEMGTAWGLEQKPWLQYILASYGVSLSEKWGRSIRNFLEEHKGALDVTLASDARSRGEWFTTAGGRVASAGVGSGITGTGMHIGVVDDPIKDAKEALSAVKRDAVWDWWGSTFSTRLTPRPDGKEPSIIVIATRWHVDDLIGRLLTQDELGVGEGWEIIRFPALAEDHDILGRTPGEALWPRVMSREKLEALRRRLDPWIWAALYQQTPIIGEDAGFPHYDDWSKYRAKDIEDKRWARHIMTVDSPYSRTEKSDFLASCVWSLDEASSDVYLRDGINQRGSFTEQEAALIDLANRNPYCKEVLIETAASGPALIKTLKDKLPGRRIIPFKPKGSKEARAAVCEQPVREARIIVPLKVERQIGYDLAMQAHYFPRGSFDDLVDTMSSMWIHWMMTQSNLVIPTPVLQAGIAERLYSF